MKKHFLVLCSLIGLVSCTTLSDFRATRQFQLSSDTDVCVVCAFDPYNLRPALENELMNVNLKLVPYETAVSATTTTSRSSTQRDDSSTTSTSTTSTYSGTYIPAGVVIDLQYRFSRYPAVTYFTTFYIRVIDTVDKHILASSTFNGNEFKFADPVGIFRDFAGKLAQYVQ
jgi:hypothetical protein